MGNVLPFKRPADGYEDVEELLREFYAEEREMRECEWLEVVVSKGDGVLLEPVIMSWLAMLGVRP